MLKTWILSIWQSHTAIYRIANVLLCLLLALVLMVGGLWVQRLPVFKVHAIEVVGLRGTQDLSHQNEAYVRHAVIPLLKGNFFSVDLRHVQRVFMQTPWVRHATVKRVWPNRIMVVLEEHQPRAQLNDGLLVNSFGEVFIVQMDSHLKALPLFLGDPALAARMLVRMNELNRWIAPLKLETSALLLSDRNAWTARLSNQMTLELGRDELNPEPAVRVEHWVKLWAVKNQNLNGAIRIDLRYPNGFAIQEGNS